MNTCLCIACSDAETTQTVCRTCAEKHPREMMVWATLTEERLIPDPCTYFQADRFLLSRLWQVAVTITDRLDKQSRGELIAGFAE